jgi:hypothetical protein
MTIEQFIKVVDNKTVRTMRRWISRSKNQFRDEPIVLHKKENENDILYCSTCGVMAEKAFSGGSPQDEKTCIPCFKNQNSANEFF